MNYLEKAKAVMPLYHPGTTQSTELAVAHALIAIAEQLEKMNDIKLLSDREFAIKYEEDK